MTQRNRASGTGSLVERDGSWIARVNLANGKKVIRIRRTREDAEAAIAEMMRDHAADLGYHYRLTLEGKPGTLVPAGPRAGLTARRRWQVLERDGHRCQYCGAPAPEVRLVVDHIIPLVDGGTHDLDNLITACSECNAGKGRLRLVS